MIEPTPTSQSDTVDAGDVQIVSGKDLAARQGQHVYRPTKGDIWLQEVQRDASFARMSLEVTGELQVLRATLQKMMDLCSVVDDATREDAIERMEKLIQELKDVAGMAAVQVVESKLDDILDLLGGGLTEINGGKKVAMSTATQINLLTKLIKEVGSLSSIQHKMDMDKFVHLDTLKIWYEQVMLATREVFSPTEVQMKQWTEKVAAVPKPKTAAD